MIEPTGSNKEEPELADKIDIKAKRKLRAQKNARSPVWFGLGMMGLVGWSVMVPTLLGTGLGIMLDKHLQDEHSWTLALMVAGVLIGCFNAWRWVSREEEAIHNEQEDKDD